MTGVVALSGMTNRTKQSKKTPRSFLERGVKLHLNLLLSIILCCEEHNFSIFGHIFLTII